jgi:hypothetical protein
VCWRTETREDKPTKVPYQPQHPRRKASSTDPGTWGTYTQAKAATGVDGIGYVFAIDDEYAGVDLDNCVDTNGRVHPEAMRIVHALDSYTEISPTGTGLHIYIRAAVNGGGHRTQKTGWGGDFENYDQARFFTFTGKHLFGTPSTINARQTELDAIRAELFPKPAAPAKQMPTVVPVTASDSDIIDKIRKSKQGRTFEPLWDGDTGAHGGDDSAADLALCNILAFWFVTPDRIDAVFRQSGLMREKWDEQRGDQTYGQQTVAKALEGRTEFYGQRAGARRHTADDPALTYQEEISSILGLIDDPIVSGWRSGRKASARVVLTTRSGAELDLESWKAATGTPKTLAQEVRLQLGADVTLKQENLNRLDVLIGKFCNLAEATTIHDRARELGETLLQTANRREFQMDNDQKSRADAFTELRGTHPAVKAKADGISLAEAITVLWDTVTGKRYVRVQWFTDYVKANAPSSMVNAILEQIEAPDWWSRPNSAGKYKATDEDGKAIYHRLFEVPKDWEKAGVEDE